MIELQYDVERNPIISIVIDGKVIDKILFIGDPHLGRRFITGVPSHRVGDREAYVYSQFSRLLDVDNDPLISKIVIVGDLFDKFVVSPTVTFEAYKMLSQVPDDIDVYLIPGNHDLSKDTTKISSFQLLTQILEPMSNNIHVVSASGSYPVYYNNAKDVLNLYFDCYNPFTDCIVNYDLETIAKSGPIISVGHWDSLSILERGYVPHQDILTHSTIIVSGHEHTYREYTYPFDKTKSKVLFTGSMQPYSHAEDPDVDIYITIKEKDLSKYDLTKDLKYKCVRIECGPLFVLSDPIECFALTYKVIAEEKTEVEVDVESVDVDNYNETLKNWVVSNKDLSKELQKELTELLDNKGYLA